MQLRRGGFDLLADNAGVMIWTSGPDKLCDFFNHAWLEFTGRTMEEELGNRWAEGVHPDDLSRCLSVYNTAFDNREPFSMEYRLRRHDSVYRSVLDIGGPYFSDSGKFLGYFGSCIDVTDRKQDALEANGPRVVRQVRTTNGPAETEIRSTLETVLISDVLRSSPQLAAFLRFVVEAELRGAGASIKGYTIAIEALGRGEDFDPSSDPIVRVEAGRLRRALRRYYEGPGADDSVIIDIPRGHYVPTFHYRRVEQTAPIMPLRKKSIAQTWSKLLDAILHGWATPPTGQR